MIQNPAISSFASVNGPSVTTRLPPDTRMRAPLELGWRPSSLSSTPAFFMSASYFLIAVTISAGGAAHFSRASAGAGNNIMNRTIVSQLPRGRLLHARVPFPDLPNPPLAVASHLQEVVGQIHGL